MSYTGRLSRNEFVLPIAIGHSADGRCLLAVIFEKGWESQAPSEKNETRRPSDHHSKPADEQKAGHSFNNFAMLGIAVRHRGDSGAKRQAYRTKYSNHF